MSELLFPQRWSRDIVPSDPLDRFASQYRVRPKSMAEVFADIRRWNDREILVQGERRLTGMDLENEVASAVGVLQSKGVRPRDRVLLIGFNSIDWIATFWAIHTIGAVAVLGNAWWDRGQIERTKGLAKPALVISDWRLYDQSDLQLADMCTAAGPAPMWPREPEIDESDPAMVLFSSGTSGEPKGVVQSQRSAVGNLHNLMLVTGDLPHEVDPERPGPRSLLTVPLFHGAGVQIMCTTFLRGGTVFLSEGKFDPEEVLRVMEAERISSWGCVPTMPARVLEHPHLLNYDVSSVRSISLGGAPVSADLRAQLAKTFRGLKGRTGSLYGLTEAGGILAAGTGASLVSEPNRVGKPLAVVEIRIADPDGEGNGEILARTPTVPDGYLGGEPIADSEGWVASGDVGQVDADGWLRVVGRSKDIIIRGGENISPARIEQVLVRHPMVMEAMVAGAPDPILGEKVVAAVVVKSSGEQVPVTIASLVAHCRSYLSSFEVPAEWAITETPLPVNATGKVAKAQIMADWPAFANRDHLDQSTPASQ